MNTIRKALIATAFSAVVAGGLTGAALSGETKHNEAASNCVTAQWPMIPAECLEGAPHGDVRYVTADLGDRDLNMKARFDVAFQ